MLQIYVYYQLKIIESVLEVQLNFMITLLAGKQLSLKKNNMGITRSIHPIIVEKMFPQLEVSILNIGSTVSLKVRKSFSLFMPGIIDFTRFMLFGNWVVAISHAYRQDRAMLI